MCMKVPDTFSVITAVFLFTQKSVSVYTPSTERQVTFGFTVQSRIFDPQHRLCFLSLLFHLEFGSAFQNFRKYLYPVVLVNNFMKLNIRRVSHTNQVQIRPLVLQRTALSTRCRKALHSPFSSVPSGVHFPRSITQLKQLSTSRSLARMSSRFTLSYLVVYFSSLLILAASARDRANRKETRNSFMILSREANDNAR